MDFFDSAYDYVISTVVGILLTLCAGLLSLRIPRSSQFSSYRKARGLLTVLLAVILADLTLSLMAFRLHAPGNVDTLIDIVCYTLVALLYSKVVDVLLENTEHGRKTMKWCTGLWLAVSVADAANEAFGPEWAYGTVFHICAALWVILIMVIAASILWKFRTCVRQMENYYSDDVSQRMEWMRNSFIMFFGWGVFSPLATIGPSWLNTIYTALGGFVYIYLGFSFINFGSDYKHISSKGIAKKSKRSGDVEGLPEPEVISAIREWEERKEYRVNGVTIETMSESLGIPEGQLISTISSQRNSSFRDYVNRMRVRDAQELLVHLADKDIDEVAQMVGYASAKEMSSAFVNTVYVTPEEWRAGVLRLIN